MDGSIFHVASTVHLCPQCKRITWGEDPCSLCRKGAVTPA